MDRILTSALIILFSFVWSSAFIVAKVALLEWAPLTLLAVRFALAALLMSPALITPPDPGIDRVEPLATEIPPPPPLRRGARASTFLPLRAPRPWGPEERRARALGLVMGLLNGAIYLGLSFSAIRLLRPEVVIVVIGLTPFFTLLIAAATGVERLNPLKVLGVLLGLMGVALVSGIGTGANPDPLGLLYALGSGLAFSFGTVLFKGKAAGLPVGPLAFWQSLGACLALLPAIALLEPLPPTVPSWGLTGAILYLTLVVTVFGMTLWLVLIRRHGAGTAASFHLLNPVTGILLAHWVLGSTIRTTDLWGAALIALGLGLTLWRQDRRPALARLIRRPLRS
ncbi:MAG: DMT family transporter [Rhodospirillum sp.]|nr:DMT family transporter [Rhodospirillum sp.]MCF8489515.1 DMT family transporter [Rhodospirillum sp.]MCF8500570.1 DMT family transporter [Rhodospirillum sp.]